MLLLRNMMGLIDGIRIFFRFTQIHWAIIGFILMNITWHYIRWWGVLLSLLPLIYFIFSNMKSWKQRRKFDPIPVRRTWIYFGGIALGFYLKDLFISYLLPYLPS